jgi:thioredoxin reductase
MTPTRNTLAIVGAGPVGLEAACAALDAGLDAHVFEQGDVADHVRAWSHVRMFTPWRANVGPASATRLERSGWQRPPVDERPTGAEFADRYLEPLAALPELAPRVHTRAQVVAIGRQGTLPADLKHRAERPFRLLVRDASGRENFLHAYAVIDASGVYGHPNRAGDGGIPARNELYLAPQLAYHLEDVLGVARERYAGKATIVIGAGDTAATLAGDLATLADAAPGTSVTWITRRPAAELYRLADDPLAARRAVHERARALASGAHAAVKHVGNARVEGLEFNSATHRYRVNLAVEELPQIVEGDRVIVAAGFGPDTSLYGQLQIDDCWATRAPMKLAAAILGAADCTSAPAVGVEALEHPEPAFWILGHKSYGRTPHFLLETGYRQVAGVVARIAADAAAGSRA